MVAAVAPMTGSAPPGRGLSSQSSRQAVGWQPSVAAAAAIHGQRLGVAQAEAVPAGQRVAGGQHEDAGFFGEGGQLEAGGADRRADEGHVGAVVQQAASRLGELEAVQPDLDRGFLRAGTRRGSASASVAARRDAQADGQHSLDRLGRVAGGGRGPVQLGQGGAGPVQEAGARGRDRRAAAAALQEPDAEDRFELLDLGAEHLLGDVHPAGGGREAAFLGDGHEVAQMPDLNVHRGRSYRPRTQNPGRTDLMVADLTAQVAEHYRAAGRRRFPESICDGLAIDR